MSLTNSDLQSIRGIVRDEVRHEVRAEIGIVLDAHLRPIQNEIKALRNDVKEIYDVLDAKADKKHSHSLAELS